MLIGISKQWVATTHVNDLHIFLLYQLKRRETSVRLERGGCEQMCVLCAGGVAGAARDTYCSWKSSMGGSKRMGLQFPRCKGGLEKTRERRHKANAE